MEVSLPRRAGGGGGLSMCVKYFMLNGSSKIVRLPVSPEVKYLGKGEGPVSSKAWGQF